jgi:hypothetical protein
LGGNFSVIQANFSQIQMNATLNVTVNNSIINTTITQTINTDEITSKIDEMHEDIMRLLREILDKIGKIDIWKLVNPFG